MSLTLLQNVYILEFIITLDQNTFQKYKSAIFGITERKHRRQSDKIWFLKELHRPQNESLKPQKEQKY